MTENVTPHSYDHDEQIVPVAPNSIAALIGQMQRNWEQGNYRANGEIVNRIREYIQEYIRQLREPPTS